MPITWCCRVDGVSQRMGFLWEFLCRICLAPNVHRGVLVVLLVPKINNKGL